MLVYLWDEEQLSVLAAAEQSAECLHGTQVEVGQLNSVDFRLSGHQGGGGGLMRAAAVFVALLPAPLGWSVWGRCEEGLIPSSTNHRRDLAL